MNKDQLLQYLLYMNIGTPAYDYANERIFAMKSGSQLPFCNRVYGDNLTNIGDLIAARMFYQATPFRWFVDQNDVVLKKQLESFGLQYKISYPAMILSLNEIQQVSYGPDIQIRKIDNADYDKWVMLVCKAYSIPAVNQFKLFIEYLLKRAQPNNIHLYIGYYQDVPAATSMVIDHATIAGLHWVGVLPEFRQKGLGFAVSHHALQDAHARGIAQAILLASEMGESIYKKIGFSEYAKYDVYGY